MVLLVLKWRVPNSCRSLLLLQSTLQFRQPSLPQLPLAESPLLLLFLLRPLFLPLPLLPLPLLPLLPLPLLLIQCLLLPLFLFFMPVPLRSKTPPLPLLLFRVLLLRLPYLPSLGTLQLQLLLFQLPLQLPLQLQCLPPLLPQCLLLSMLLLPLLRSSTLLLLPKLPSNVLLLPLPLFSFLRLLPRRLPLARLRVFSECINPTPKSRTSPSTPVRRKFRARHETPCQASPVFLMITWARDPWCHPTEPVLLHFRALMVPPLVPLCTALLSDQTPSRLFYAIR